MSQNYLAEVAKSQNSPHIHWLLVQNIPTISNIVIHLLLIPAGDLSMRIVVPMPMILHVAFLNAKPKERLRIEEFPLKMTNREHPARRKRSCF